MQCERFQARSAAAVPHSPSTECVFSDTWRRAGKAFGSGILNCHSSNFVDFPTTDVLRIESFGFGHCVHMSLFCRVQWHVSLFLESDSLDRGGVLCCLVMNHLHIGVRGINNS